MHTQQSYTEELEVLQKAAQAQLERLRCYHPGCGRESMQRGGDKFGPWMLEHLQSVAASTREVAGISLAAARAATLDDMLPLAAAPATLRGSAVHLQQQADSKM